MIHLQISLPDDFQAALDTKTSEGGYLDHADFVRALVETAVADDDDDGWEMTPELAAALEAGERSGISPRSFDEIIDSARRAAGLR